jgi:gamma-glutamyl-gamma-aminobutyrate hydrolase PuuD
LTDERRPLIGLTIGPENETSDYLRLRATYPRAIEDAGGVPVLIPPLADGRGLQTVLASLDGLVLPGGADLDPSYYGEPPHPKTHVLPHIDELELAAARWAREASVPTLGICRGQQTLNVAFGGRLIQHLDGHRQGEPRDALTHLLRVREDSRLARIFEATAFDVNSHHHQAVPSDGLGTGLRPVAWSPDGVVEGLEAEDHPWLLAVQFHPEDLVGFHEPSQRLFRAFVSACRQHTRRYTQAFP